MVGRTARTETVERTNAMSTDTPDRTLDVREIDGEPFSDIVAELDAIDADETFVLVNSFEPEPLYQVLERRGFAYETVQVGDDEWRVAIEHTDDCRSAVRPVLAEHVRPERLRHGSCQRVDYRR
jgi:uncharacterized protein (DUF2249 family)